MEQRAGTVGEESVFRSGLVAVAFSVGVSIVSVIVPVWAQEAENPAQTPVQAETPEQTEPARKPRRTLDEVVVTAQKRKQDIQDVPMSVSAIGELQIEQSNMEDLNDLSRYTPNLKVQAGGVANFVYIRGLGSGFNEGFEQSVGLFIDDVYYAKPHYLVTGLVDVERVEILRGPQGTLFGKNTVAGALAIHSGQPIDEWEASFDGTLGQQKQKNFQALLNVPIVEDKLSFRVAGYYWKREGLLYNSYADFQEKGFLLQTLRAKLKFDPLENLSFTLTYLRNDGEGFGGARLQMSAAPDRWMFLFRQRDPDAEASITDFNTSIDKPTTFRQISDDFILKGTLEAWNHDFTLVAGASTYKRRGASDIDGTPVQVFEAEALQDYTQYTAELRVASPPGVFEYVAGLFYTYNDLDEQSTVLMNNTPDLFAELFDLTILDTVLDPLPDGIENLLNMLTPPVGAFLERREGIFQQESQSISIFGQITWNVTDTLSLIAGARYGTDWKDVFYDQKIGNPLLFPGPTVVYGPILRLETFSDTVSRKESDFAPKGSVLWRFTEWGNLYATIAVGGKSGGFNALALRDDETQFRPERAITYEAGLKTELLGGAMRLNMGVFRTHFTDLQTSIFNGIDIVVKNAPKAVSQGVEIDANAIFDFGLAVIGSFAYLDAFYTDYPEGPCVARSILLDVALGARTCNLDGAPLPNALDIQASLSLNQTIPLGGWPVDLTLGSDILYHGKMYMQPDLDPLDVQDPYVMVNARIGVQSHDLRYSFTIFVRNVFDEIVRLGSIDAPLFDGTHVAVIDQPRTWSFHFSIKY